MNITVRQPFLGQLKDKGFKKIDDYLRYSDWNSAAAMKLDVGMMTDAELTKVLAVIGKDQTVNAHSLKTIELFKKAKANPKNAKARTLEHFATILKEYIASIPKYRIFQQGDDGDWNAYVAVGVGYIPPKRTRHGTIAPYVFLKAAYYDKGEICYSSWHFNAFEIKNKTCSEVIDDSLLITGAQELDTQFEKELVRYKELRGAVGKQVLGTGMCQSISDNWHRNSYALDIDGRKARLVIDDHVEGTNKNKNESTDGEAPILDGAFWKEKGLSADDDDDSVRSADDDTAITLEVPLRPMVLVFNLEKHEQAWAHVNRLEDYVYDTKLGEKLVLPDYQRELIEILVQRDRAEMQDIIKGKAGGSVVLCSGVPGTGKTLTAEVFAETIERPLYVVASSQLGTDASELEEELKQVLGRAARLGAILLIDEADVFIHERGESMVQNAVVGVFLRVLEYYQGVLFMTTNRATVVDDAIISRCTAQVKFEIPSPEGQRKIWGILSGLSKIKMAATDLDKFVKAHPRLSGRDVKGLLKLANLIATKRKKPIDGKMLEYVLQFKPTNEEIEKAAAI